VFDPDELFSHVTDARFLDFFSEAELVEIVRSQGKFYPEGWQEYIQVLLSHRVINEDEAVWLHNVFQIAYHAEQQLKKS